MIIIEDINFFPPNCLVLDSHLNLNSGLDHDGGDALDDISSGVQVNDTLVDAHLEAVPGL